MADNFGFLEPAMLTALPRVAAGRQIARDRERQARGAGRIGSRHIAQFETANRRAARAPHADRGFEVTI